MSPLVTDRSPADTDAPAGPDLPWSLIETAPYDVDAADPDEPTGTPVEADRGGSRGASMARRLLRDRRSWVALPLLTVFVALATVPGMFVRVEPTDCRLARSLDAPETGHPFGFDLLGCDYFSRTVYGARTSLLIAAVVVIVALIIAVTLGALAGLLGGPVDVIISRTADVVFGVPVVLGGLVIVAVQDTRGIPQAALVLAVLSWPAMLRLMRIAVRSQLQVGHVEAALALGASRWRVLRRHGLATAVGPLLVYATALTGSVVAAEATLSFMGVGLQLPAISWGLQLAAAQPHVAQAPHLLIPGLFVTLAVLGFVLTGDVVRDALDPQGTT